MSFSAIFLCGCGFVVLAVAVLIAVHRRVHGRIRPLATIDPVARAAVIAARTREVSR